MEERTRRRTTRRRWLVAITVAWGLLAVLCSFVVVVAACTSFSAGPPDGGDGALIPSDGAAILDANTNDGAGDGDGSTQRLCQTINPAPTFCTDFDDGVFPPPNTSLDQIEGTTERGGVAYSKPSSFKSVLKTSTMTHKTARIIVGPISQPKSPSSVTLSFWIRLDGDALAGEVHLFTIADNAEGIPAYGIRLSLDKNPGVPLTVFDLGGNQPRTRLVSDELPVNKWFKVELTLTAASAAFTLNGTIIPPVLTNTAIPTKLYLRLGLVTDTASVAIGVHFDDVVFNVNP